MNAELEKYFFEKVNIEFQSLCLLFHELILDIHPSLQASLKWQMPTYDINGLCIGIGAFKKKVTIFFHRGAEMTDFDQLFEGQEKNKCMRSLSIFSMDSTNFEQVEKYLREAVRVNLEVTPVKKVTKPIPLPPVPQELLKALNENIGAREFFLGLNKTHKREFISWINSAKRPETKRRRVLLSIEKLHAQLTCHHKYKK